MSKGKKVKINLEVEVDLGLFQQTLRDRGIYRNYDTGQIANTLVERINETRNYEEVVKVQKATIEN
tara:strand:- start:973 stop:1170 length:198 start_codon:yes stop_codon:yes gene_type:complete